MKSKAHIALLTLFLCNAPVLSQTATVGGLAGAAMRMGFGARGIGLGNALSAVSSGDIDSYYNPALVPFQSSPVAMASYGVLTLDRKLNFVSYTQSLKPSAGVSIGVINAGVSAIDGRDRDGVHTEDFSTSENSFFLSFGLRLQDNISVGITTKILYYKLFEDIHSTTLGIDVGAFYLLSNELSFGAVLQDIGSKYKWDTSNLYGQLGTITEDKFPLRKRIAASYTPKDLGVLLCSEFEVIGLASYWRIGSEVGILPGFQIRGGIDQISISGTVNAKPSFGFSFRAQAMGWTPTIHYTYVLEPYTPNGLHVLALSANFE